MIPGVTLGATCEAETLTAGEATCGATWASKTCVAETTTGAVTTTVEATSSPTTTAGVVTPTLEVVMAGARRTRTAAQTTVTVATRTRAWTCVARTCPRCRHAWIAAIFQATTRDPPTTTPAWPKTTMRAWTAVVAATITRTATGHRIART